ncbi:MAG TPA: adenosine deaminase family protein [Spirochaetia bacterium]|nr:adenosine deaminase family protein [Spirochaetia bacterium]
MDYPVEFLRAIPKTDLHVHLDGSLRLSTLIELAKERKITLPSYTEEGLTDLVFKRNYKDLDEYLTGFALTTRVMQDAESLERIGYELAMDNIAEGVRYIEVRYAPQLHMNANMGMEAVVRAVDSGMRRAREETNKKLSDGEPPFEYGLILCAMRFFTDSFSDYYADLYRLHPFSNEQDIIRLASLDLARAAAELRHSTDMQIVAFDLAGSEFGYPASAHEESYSLVHKNFLKKTVHAGEAYGPESIFQAITKLHAERIGHGLHIFDAEMIYSPDIKNKNAYVEDLVNYIADQRITVEVCLTSNLQTSPNMKSVKDHSLGKMLAHNLSVTFCTDNRLVSHTTVTDEIALAANNFAISPKQLKDLIIYGFKRSFFYRSYPEKRRYVRKVIDYYDMIEQKYRIRESVQSH